MPPVGDDLPDLTAVGRLDHRRNFAFPRRVPSIPGCVTGGVSFGSAAAAVNAVFATGHDTSKSRAACTTVRPRSVADSPTEVRSRDVNRDRGGIDGSASVDVLRRHCSLTHRHRRSVQVGPVHRPATCRSRGRVRTQECGRPDRTPQSGRHRNVVGAVLDADDLHPGQAEQPRRIVGQARGPSRDPSSVATRRITERHGRSAPVRTLTENRAHRERLMRWRASPRLFAKPSVGGIAAGRRGPGPVPTIDFPMRRQAVSGRAGRAALSEHLIRCSRRRATPPSRSTSVASGARQTRPSRRARQPWPRTNRLPSGV